MKKIYVDLSRLSADYAGGVARFSLGLTAALLANPGDAKVALIVSPANYSYISGLFKGAEILVYPYCRFYRYALAAAALIAYVVKRPDLLIPASYLFSPLPKELQSPDVLVLCPTSTLNFYSQKITSLLCIHDIQHEIYPENFSPLVRAVRWAQYRLSATLSKWVQVSSHAIQADLLQYYSEPMDKKTFIAPEGFDEALFSPDLPDEKPAALAAEPFVYYPAQLWKHKNHATVIEGLRIFNDSTSLPLSLVLTGKDYGELKKILAVAAANEVKILHLGIVPESQMRWLYRNAVCAVAAGYHESSSLPVREAIASGGCILAADIPPNMEIKALTGLTLFETFSPESFAAQLKALFTEKASPTPRQPPVGGECMTIEDFAWSKIIEIYRKYF